MGIRFIHGFGHHMHGFYATGSFVMKNFRDQHRDLYPYCSPRGTQGVSDVREQLLQRHVGLPNASTLHSVHSQRQDPTDRPGNLFVLVLEQSYMQCQEWKHSFEFSDRLGAAHVCNNWLQDGRPVFDS
jgi:hypothetical protein